jgi:hypothetical protein
MFAKIFTSIFEGTMYGNPDGIITLMVMLVLADPEGMVDMTPQAIAARTSIPLDIIKRGIEFLEQPDHDSRSDREEGRRIKLISEDRSWGWQIVNYEHYRKLRSEEERREYLRNWKREARAKNKESTPVHSSPQCPPILESESESELESRKNQESEVPRAKRSAATRLPSDFILTAEMRAEAQAEQLDPARTFAKFCDYWRAASGAKARKHDWLATWRNWCRSEHDRGGKFNGTRAEPSQPEITWRPPPDAPDHPLLLKQAKGSE